MINNLDRAIVLDHLPELPDGAEASDPNDDFLLAMILAGDADFLVTGERSAGLLQRSSFQRARILNPGAFCAELGLSATR
jgi:predicted nucleic acid-binding protein